MTGIDNLVDNARDAINVRDEYERLGRFLDAISDHDFDGSRGAGSVSPWHS